MWWLLIKVTHPQLIGSCKLATTTTATTTALFIIIATTGILSEDCFHGFYLLSVGFMRDKWNAIMCFIR